jgi:hypothetical protein
MSDAEIQVKTSPTGAKPAAPAAPRPASAPAPVAAKQAAPATQRWIRKIRMTNRAGQIVVLLAPGGLLQESEGLGQRLIQLILDGTFPLRITLGKDVLTVLDVRAEAETSDRVVVLLSGDTGKGPGSVISRPDHEMTKAGAPGKVTTFLVQPAAGNGPLAFDQATNDTLGKRILQEMIGQGAGGSSHAN